jgi:hypothetical protein
MTTQKSSQKIVTLEGNRSSEQINHSMDANGPVLPEKLGERIEKCR